MEVVDEHLKGKEFAYVVAGDDGVSVDLEHPSILLESLPHLLVLPPRGLKDEGCNFLGPATKQPWRVPKRRFGAIAHC